MAPAPWSRSSSRRGGGGGGGNEPHAHLTYAERFEAVEGTLTVRVGDAFHRLAPGEDITAVAGQVHCFRNDTDEAVTFRAELTPGHRGFERALQAHYGPATDGRTRGDGLPRSLYESAILVEWSDTALVGRRRVLMPLLRLLARRAKRLGVDRRLEERYCRW